MSIAIWNNSLIARIGLLQYSAALKQEFVGEFDITGRPMRGWVVVSPDGIDNDDELRRWIQLATAFVEDLPAK